MCCNYRGRRLVGLKEREKSDPTGNLQVATDGSGTDCLRGALVSSVFALAPRCRRATRGTRPAGRPHHGLAMGSALRAGTRAEAAVSSQADQQIREFRVCSGAAKACEGGMRHFEGCKIMNFIGAFSESRLRGTWTRWN